MLAALLAWAWGGLAPWLVWLWAMFAGCVGHALQTCGVVWLGERVVKWWQGDA